MKTIKEIAAECGVSEQAVRAWCRRNHVAKDAKGSFPRRSVSLKKRIVASSNVNPYSAQTFSACSLRSESISNVTSTNCDTQFTTLPKMGEI